MRIAVTYENGQIFQHFGHTETFKIYDVEEGKVVHSEVVDTNGSGHGALAGVLNALNADVLICGGIGGGAQTALAAAGIKLFGGVSGDADEAVEAFINETLAYNPNVKCSHHEHNHGEGHTCGEHGCVSIAVIKKNGSPKSGYWEIVDKYLYFIGPYFIGSNHDILY